MSRQGKKVVAVKKDDGEKKKSLTQFYFKAEKKDYVNGKFMDQQYFIKPDGAFIKFFKKVGDKAEKIVIKTNPDGKYEFHHEKDGKKADVKILSPEDVKKMLEKEKNFSFLEDNVKPFLAIKKKGGSKKRVLKKNSKKKVAGGSKKKKEGSKKKVSKKKLGSKKKGSKKKVSKKRVMKK